MRSEGGFLVSKVHQLSGRIFNRLLRENGIEFNSAQGRILFALWQGDGIPIRELSEKTRLSKSSD
jgi:DNA-binding MarR family transcriptional regulator